jgi:hypothetical protein
MRKNSHGHSTGSLSIRATSEAVSTGHDGTRAGLPSAALTAIHTISLARTEHVWSRTPRD